MEASRPSTPRSPRRRPLRLIYGAGPGDVLVTYSHWREGRDDPGQVSVTYSGQFYSLVRELGARACVISSSNRVQTVRENEFVIVNRPMPLARRRAILYFTGQWIWALRFIVSALRFGADAAVIDMTMCSMRPLRILPRLGIPLILSGHVVLWPKLHRPQGLRWRFQKLLASTLTHAPAAILSITSELDRQIRELTGGRSAPIIRFVPTYRRGAIENVPPPPAEPFRVMFAGRLVRDKGVFDLVEIARILRERGYGDIHIDIAGDGPDLEPLQKAIRNAALQDRVHVHGYCKKDRMRDLLSATHVCIVPTRSGFVEGIAKTVIEGVMSGRPVVTSEVCGGAVDHVGDAVILVPPDDPRGYAEAIIRLRTDRDLYETKRQACGPIVEKFYDPSRGWAAAVKQALRMAKVI
jgi:glycogen(starch) synthase